MAADAGNRYHIAVSLETRSHGPKYIIRVKYIHILIHKDHMLELRESGEGQKSGLPLLALVRVDGFAALQNRDIFAAAGAVRIAVQHFTGESLVDHTQDRSFRGDA